MNNSRRKKIHKSISYLNDINTIISSVLDEEQCVFDNIPENLQDSIKGDKIQNAVSQLEDAIESIEDAIESLSEAAL